MGQVYGHHFQRGGASVAFLVKPAHAEAAHRGFVLHPLNVPARKRMPVPFTGFSVFTEATVAAREKWDAIVLCVTTDALGKGSWLRELCAGLGDATLVSLQGGLEGRAQLAALVPPEQTVSGVIAIISYAAPLPGESLAPGVAYWLPPLVKNPFSGPRAAAVAEVLNRGGLPSSVAKGDLTLKSAVGEAVLGSLIMALEIAGWSFDALRRDRELRILACRMMREGAQVAARHHGFGAPLAPRLIRPWMLRAAVRALPPFFPMDIETYLRVHFTKVGPQMHDALGLRIARGQALGIETPAMRDAVQRLAA